MPEAEGGSPTPPGVQTEEKEPESQKLFGPGGVIRKLAEDSAVHPLLQRRARMLDQTPESLHTAGFLKRQFEGVLDQATKEEIPENEAIGFLASLSAEIEKLDDQEKEQSRRLSQGSGGGTAATLERIAIATETQVEKNEPDVERLPLPETAGECVKLVEDQLFSLLQKAIAEKKQTKDYASAYKAVERLIERIPAENKYKGFRHEELSRHLASRFPEGVFLKEKLTLLLEAMRNLTDRTVEVINAEGSLMKLGVEKPQTPLAKEMLVTLTNIEPVNWYVLTHLDELFKEEAGSIPETRLNIQAAWDEWRGIGDRPYGKFRKWDFDRGHWKDKEEFDLVPMMLFNGSRLIPKGERLQEGRRLMSEEKERIREKGEKPKEETTELCITLESIYRSEAVELMVRKAIAREVESGTLSERGVRSELLAWCFLKVGLTFDMWDRNRWKVKGDSGARDLMWFPYKQIERVVAQRSGGGVFDTAGSYWAYEGQSDLAWERYEREKTREAKEFYEILRRNEGDPERRKPGRAVFLVEGDWKAQGTIIGDFWSSTAYSEGEDKIQLVEGAKLEKGGLKGIPFLDIQSQVEGGVYASYFGYSMAMANLLVESFMNTGGGQGWKVEDWMSPNFWRGETDKLVRLDNYCPVFIARNEEKKDKKTKREITQEIARTFARGIFWLGSYQAQPTKELLGISTYTRGAFTFEQVQAIKTAIREARFLDEEHYNGLLADLREFNFLGRGAKQERRR